MASSPLGNRSRLTPLQADLLEAFFALERRFFLTGGGALAGFYLGHRSTEDLDLFTAERMDLAEGARVLRTAAERCDATLVDLRTEPEFRRLLAARGDERCVVDLVVDRAPAVDPDKSAFGAIRVDTLREIAANKICAVLGRGEAKDLVDLQRLIEGGADLSRTLADAVRKDGGVNPATLAWILDQISISPTARLPGNADPVRLDAFRTDLVKRLRAEALRWARERHG